MKPTPFIIRRTARFAVRWPLVYGNDDLIAQGTLLDVSATGCRFAGTMPLEPGMPLWLQVHPEQREGLISIEQASVVWIKNNEFGLELKQLRPADQGPEFAIPVAARGSLQSGRSAWPSAGAFKASADRH